MKLSMAHSNAAELDCVDDDIIESDNIDKIFVFDCQVVCNFLISTIHCVICEFSTLYEKWDWEMK